MSFVNEQPTAGEHRSLRTQTARLLRRAWTYLRENDLSGLDGVQL